ncbi:DNA repair protein (mre11) [Cryptococcus neoformans C23]|uniref:Double-strand break repair protein n=1 Tax=Cryptococcus neoformans (strain H99 / ATCC 208821 / CBS 10515 / FGSC 9487) TaxID=235443 RepID=J9VRU5_CRYN9|nr:DNA repair protein MRE11 [Cryptococcus neoformans var. grubii H99]AUB25139.1 DNA repair protein MRE11 [Cryptococcus neoformans var. grubii]OWZ31415.1 DNA repair protein (mre11) [Cryptococcus neoformans var. grubii AD2-60a]OWZ43576.1 DNA repair protein (mre11) [Cryptococcus neoformans var. grubii C23]OXC84493.1 DNA repair protein (mre11) [Cryptococcus neoformans var. grubii AD1-7a]OXG32668.1 DNA repair protein (mre11) [Cryptococcus neoformans var. grubii Bt15]OXG41341.1 DNA repair protein (|eukprot:XP_012049694.1 DNA repair protein MRE11 [Cryptococcus neoformans var. grubii H99]
MSAPNRVPDSQPSSEIGDEPPPSIVEPDLENCFRILIATDNHIGYAEKDPVRGQDSINTFREILELARDHDVDFILLAGDLFHENRPSRTCMHQTIALLREFTLGDKPIEFELLSDPMDGSTPGFSFPAVNYEDPNINIAIPVFSIHGNHDDPQGTGPEGALCALDVLSVSGVLNYFGKSDLVADESAADNPEKGIHIRPVLLRKGTTHVALYGCGNIRDQRMYQELRANKVKMFMPTGGDVPDSEWFNILLVHQNRVRHGPQNYVPENMFDDSMRLVIWGHEHDCRITPESVADKNYFITQPGSSVATSLAPGEAVPKHVGLLSIQGSQFQLEELPLKTVRPFELDEVVLSYAAEQGAVDLNDRDSITSFLREQVEALILQAKKNWKERNNGSTKNMMLPLIRLKVETTDAKEMVNPVRFGQEYVNRVANPRDILQYYRKKKNERKVKNNPDMPNINDDEWEEDPESLTADERLSKLRMATLVKQYLQAQSLDVLVENGMEDAVMRFVDKDDKDAIKDFVADTLRMVGRKMKEREVKEDDVDLAMAEAKEKEYNRYADSNPVPSQSVKGKNKQRDSDVDSMMASDDDMDMDEMPTQQRAPVRRATANQPVRSAKGKGKQPLFENASEEEEDEEEEEEEEEEPAPKKGRGRAAAASTKKAPAKKPPARTPAKSTTKAPAGRRPAVSQPSTGRGVTQSQLTFSRSGTGKAAAVPIELSSDED